MNKYIEAKIKLFEEKFVEYLNDREDREMFNKMELFIKQTLTDHRQQILQEIEEKLPKKYYPRSDKTDFPDTEWKKGFNECFDEIKETLKEML